jgi:branched-chain amino acid aminotransferase
MTSTDSAPPPAPLAWVDGEIVPAAEATVPLMDDGTLRGDAVFDAMLVRGGRTHAREAHLARLRASGAAIDITIPDLNAAIDDLLRAWGERDGSVKVIVTRGGNVRGVVAALTWPATMALATVDMPWRSALSGVKTLSYAANQWALRQARRAGADDALIVTDGVVQELPTGAIVTVHGERLRTPNPDRQPILRSITVQQVREVADVEPARLTVDDVHAADEAFVLSATRPVLPVHAIDDVELPAPGPVTARVLEAFDQHVAATLDPRP